MADCFIAPPCVFAVAGRYYIAAAASCELTYAVQVGKETYYDHSNGVLRTASRFHGVFVPADALDTAREYTVHVRRMLDREPYFSKTADPESYTYRFAPLTKTDGIRLIHIADTHGAVDTPVSAARAAGNADILVLNGDIQDHSGSVDNFDAVYRIAGNITGGSIPAVFSRGNHDLRGNCAELFAACVPNDGGRSYYTFRLGCVWGVVLDCGEDKRDTNAEYGNTICCHAFREEQTAFLRDVCERREYADPDIKYRLVIAHNPFTYTMEPPFDIEQELYSEWAGLLREYIKPTVMLCGHLHLTCVSKPGGKFDSKGQPCDVIIGSAPGDKSFTAASVTLVGGGYSVDFVKGR